MTQNFLKYFLILPAFIVSSCTGVQDYVFPSLSDEEVVAPPALEEVPATIETVEQPVQEIPPSQYAQPAVSNPQVAYDTGPTGTFVGGKLINFEQTFQVSRMLSLPITTIF